MNASLEYCGPLSLTTLLGIPCSENTCFLVDMTILLVVRPFILLVVSHYQIFMIIAVKQICADNFPCSAGDVKFPLVVPEGFPGILNNS